MYESVAQAHRAAPSGDEDVRKCRSSVPCCTLGRRKSTKVLPKRAVLHPRATKKCESVAQESRAAPLGDDKVRKCCPREPCCTLGRRKSAKVLPKRAVLHPRATKMYESVAQESRAAPSGDEDVRKCRPSVPCCTLGRRKSAKVLPKRAVLHPWATIKHESVAQESRAALLGDDKCGFRCRRVSFIHTSFCPAPLGNGKARKSRLTVPRVTFGCGTVRRHRSRRARHRPLLLSLEGFRGSVAWSCGHYIGHYIRHIRLIFGNFYYFCPDACHDDTSRAGDARLERDTDRKGDRWSPSYLPRHR